MGSGRRARAHYRYYLRLHARMQYTQRAVNGRLDRFSQPKSTQDLHLPAITAPLLPFPIISDPHPDRSHTFTSIVTASAASLHASIYLVIIREYI